MNIKNEYFASANSRIGFKSYFSEIFNPNVLEKLYIIKGGSGTGKSTMIKSIGEYCEGNGHTADYFLCSSDNTSYDGVLIDDIKVAVIDGTAPHTTDPIYPGAVDVIVNTGEFWNETMLKNSRNEIMNIYKNKGGYFSKAFGYLKAAGDITDEMLDVSLEGFRHEKMKAAAERLAKAELKRGAGYAEEKRLISSISNAGYQTLPTFEKNARRVCLMKNCHGAGHLFLEELVKEAKQLKLKIYLSVEPLDTKKINALYFPELRYAALALTDDGGNRYDDDGRYKIVNMERFFDLSTLKKNRQRLRFAKKCTESLMSGAVTNLTAARAEHDKLEEIYIKSMDFKAKEELTKCLCEKIVSAR